jgi:hypothetical protein
MVPALGRDDFPLDETQKLLALRQGQAKIREIANITRATDLHHVDVLAGTFNPDFH